MRRGIAFLLPLSALIGLTPTAFGQSPYPYGPLPMQYSQPPYGYPAPVQYMQPYGYSPQMPVYGPNPMMARPMYYAPAPMMPPPGPTWQAPAANNTKVFVYGPLLETYPRSKSEFGIQADPGSGKLPVAVPPHPLAALRAGGMPTPGSGAGGEPGQAGVGMAPTSESSGVSTTQGTSPEVPAGRRSHRVDSARVLPTFSKMDLLPESCGPGCDDCPEACSPPCGPQPYEPPMRGHGHFIGEVGAYFLSPLSTSRIAYNTTRNGATTSTDFPHQVDWGPRAWLG